MSERLHQVNRMLDRACKALDMDPVEVRLAMVQTLHAKLAKPVIHDRDAGMINGMTGEGVHITPCQSDEAHRLESYKANGT